MRLLFKALVFTTLVTSTLCFAQDNLLKAPSTDVNFPKEISFPLNGKEISLHATGVATRSKFFVNIYSMAHYMKHPVKGKRSIIFDEILNDHQTKQITLKWVRDVEGFKVRETFAESIEKVLRYQPANISNEMDEFLGFFKDGIKSGDENILRWIPEGTLEVEINGKVVGVINSEEFVQTLWGIWFGPKSVVSRNRLVALLQVK